MPINELTIKGTGVLKWEMCIKSSKEGGRQFLLFIL
jgi:hypothetical protein